MPANHHTTPDTKKCIKCGETKDASEFIRDQLRSDGLFPYCKRCVTKHPDLYDERRFFEPLGLRRCGTCKLWKDKSEFHQSRKGLHGLDSKCKSCKHSLSEGTIARQELERRETETGLRVCKKCGETKSLGDYYPNLRRCKTCVIEQTREYRLGHPDIYREAVRRYQKKNPGLVQAINHTRRAYKKGAPGSFTPQEWLNLKEQYDHTCLMCGRREPEIKLTVDHVISVSNGGPNDISNIQPLCRSCNSSKGDKAIDLRPDHKKKA